MATAKGAIVGVTRELGEAAAAFRDRVEQAIASATNGVRRAGREAMAFAGDAGSAAGDVAGSLVDRGEAGLRSVYDYGRSAAHGVRGGADDAMHRAQDLGSRATAYLQEQPLLLGAIGVTLGAALGMLLPSSRYEREMLGEVREGLRDTAAEAVRDVRDRAVRVAESVVDTAQEATRREGLADLAPAGLAASAREQVADTAGRFRGVVEKSAAAGRQALERELTPTTAPRLPTAPTRDLPSMTEAVSSAEPDRADVIGPGKLPGPHRVRRRLPRAISAARRSARPRSRRAAGGRCCAGSGRKHSPTGSRSWLPAAPSTHCWRCFPRSRC